MTCSDCYGDDPECFRCDGSGQVCPLCDEPHDRCRCRLHLGSHGYPATRDERKVNRTLCRK